MLSEIVKNVALILDDQEALTYLSNPSDSYCESVNMYISITNFVLTNIAQNFLCYKCTEEVVSTSNARLQLADLSNKICAVKSVKNQDFKKVKYTTSLDYLQVDDPVKMYYVEYYYLPSTLTSLDDTLLLPYGLDYKTLCYGVVSEYFAIKMQFTEANIWEQKFKQGLRVLAKQSKDYRLAVRGLL